MRLAEGIEALELSGAFAGRRVTFWPIVFDDPDGATLVDTGYPGWGDAVLDLLASLSIGAGRIRRIVLTHQDFDHIGGARRIRDRSMAPVLAHADDIPFIQGERPLLKLNFDRFRERLKNAGPEAEGQVRTVLAAPPTVRVDEALVDGQVLPIHGGVRVIHTPGHSPGHVCLYVPSERLLIAADELRVINGELVGPNPPDTPDMDAATRSLRKLSELDVERVLCFHGGLWGPDAGRRLREIAQS